MKSRDVSRLVDERRAILGRAQEEAWAFGSSQIEAEHLLLALTSDRGKTGRVLRQAGLDHETLRTALAAEFEGSLEAVGVSLSSFDLPSTITPRTEKKLRLATSAKLALRRAVLFALARGDRRISSTHMLIGLLRAQIGTVPRALVAAGVDQFALATQAEQSLERAA